MKRKTKNTLKLGALLIGGYLVASSLPELFERHNHWDWSRKYCDSVNKPLLRIGMKRSFLEPPNGDVTLDLSEEVLGIKGGVLGDECDMPFKDKQFGVCFNEHTLEHLRYPEDVEAAVKECVRVADYAVLLAPSPYSIYATFFCPTHLLLLWFDDENNEIRVMENKYNTGFGFNLGENLPPRDQRGIGQAMVLHDKFPVVKAI